jgi:murein DD-endopeptidase MepM/ murein hydrolase activator NlpD
MSTTTTTTYRFDSEMLAYVAVERNSSAIFKLCCRYLFLAFVLGGFVFKSGWVDPIIQAVLSWQNQVYMSKIESYTGYVAKLHIDLATLHAREQQFYRSLLNLQPTDAGIWKAGYGGGGTYKNVQPHTLRDLIERLHNLRYQTGLQKLAFEASLAEAKRMQERTHSFPVLIPAQGVCVSGFGHRCTSHHGTHFHSGVDLAACLGTPVYAAGEGIVRLVGWQERGYGLQVQIDHRNGFITRYAHLSASDVKPGQKISRGEKIGRIGSTGISTGPHLHYEVISNGLALNPSPFMLLPTRSNSRAS